MYPTRPSIVIPSPTFDPSTPFPHHLMDALPVMQGICFEAANDASGQTFVLRSAEDHIRFYDLADNSRLCSRPVTRYPFDFSTGMVLVGTWNRGRGCTANHEILSFERDDNARSIRMIIRLLIEGDCPYELVRPFWVGIPNATDYTITLETQP